MTTIAHCSNDAEAMLLKSLLEANGLEVFAPDKFTALDGLNVGGSGLRLQVNDEDAEAARKILAEAEAADDADDDDDDDDEDDEDEADEATGSGEPAR